MRTEERLRPSEQLTGSIGPMGTYLLPSGTRVSITNPALYAIEGSVVDGRDPAAPALIGGVSGNSE